MITTKPEKNGPVLAPTLLCADPLNLENIISRLDKLDIRWHHIDVMDGHFVPNLGFGLDTVCAVCSVSKKPVYAHMMVNHPGNFIKKLSDSGVWGLSFHPETTKQPFRLAETVRETGMHCGAAVSPIVSADSLNPLLPYLDVLTIMAVEPGYSGQTLLPMVFKKIFDLRRMADNAGLSLIIEVDGGIDEINGPECIRQGADVLVGGAFSLFRKDASPEENYYRFMEKLKEV